MPPMAELIYAGVISGGAPQPPAIQSGPRPAAASFQTVLNEAAGGDRVQRAVARAPAAVATKNCPGASLDALNAAMAREGVPASWQPHLAFIMAQESGGRVDAKSHIHSARGLYQLTAANYHYNPRGGASFGDAVEEAQGGIRYIRARYGTAENAAAFWQRHRWY